MPYLGSSPQEQYASIGKQTVTGNGGTAYTLNHITTSPEDIEVFINNVRQEPTTSYTVSGTTLTLTEALLSTDTCYVIYQGRTVGTRNPPTNSVGTTAIIDNAVTGAKIPATGITNAHLHTDMNLVSKTVKLGTVQSSDGSTSYVVASDGTTTFREPIDISGKFTHDSASSTHFRTEKVYQEQVYMDILNLWHAADTCSHVIQAGDGGSVSYDFHNGNVVRVNTSVGSHHWEAGRFHLEPGSYRFRMCYRTDPNAHGWSSFGSGYSNGHGIRLTSDHAYGSYTTYLSLDITQHPFSAQHAFVYYSSIYTTTTAMDVRITQMTQPYAYGSGGYPFQGMGGGKKYSIISQHLMKVA